MKQGTLNSKIVVLLLLAAVVLYLSLIHISEPTRP